GGARRPVCALPRRLLRAGGRGLRDGALRGVPLRQAGRDHDGRGRAARRRLRPGHGPRRRAARRGARQRAALPRRARGRRARLGRRRQGPRRAGDLGPRRREAARAVRVAYYSPLPPETSGIADYSALLLPALRERIDVEVVKRGRTKAPRGADVSLYHVGNSPEAHAWIVDALRRTPGVLVLHELVLHHLVAGLTIGRKNGPAYLDAMERDSGLPGRLLAHGVLEGRVLREEYVPEERLWSLMGACDVLVSLRAPTMGETSGSVLRGLSLGKPLVVSDVGWFSELEGAARIPPGDGEVEALAAALLSPPPPAHAGPEHDVGRVADAYVEALERAAGGEAVRDSVYREVAGAAAAVGIEETAELSTALREVGLGE